MKNLIAIGLVVLCTSAQLLYAQDKSKEGRESPPATVSGTIGKANIVIDYSRPSVKGREIWGKLVPFDKVWRTGANEATTFATDKDIKVEGSVLPKGKYAFFSIPKENGEWTLIFNQKWDQFGAFKYKEKDDQLRINVKATKAPSFVEQLTFYIEGNRVLFRWENTEVGFSASE